MNITVSQVVTLVVILAVTLFGIATHFWDNDRE